MQKALMEYNTMSREQFEVQFNKYSYKVENNLNLYINSSMLSARSAKTESNHLIRPDYVKILCRDCSKMVCNGDHIKYREPNYICEPRVLLSKVNEVDKKFYCLTKSCNKELGKLMEIRNASPFYILDIKGIKFEMPGLEVQVFGKWSKVTDYFAIKPF